MWKLNAWAQTRAGVTGVPWRDLSDEEYVWVASQFEEGALLPYFEHVDDGAPEPAPAEPEPAAEPEQPATPMRHRGARRGDR